MNSPGALTAQTLINYGTAAFQAGTSSTVGTLINSGTLNISGNNGGGVGGIGTLTVGRLETMAGLITVWENGGTLINGSGTLPSGVSGYYQFANGIFDEAGGALSIHGPIDLNGTLDILLGDGYKPVGSVFDVLTGGPITGTFSNVEGLVFDDGRERYVLTYGDPTFHQDVYLTVENNTTPEPASAFLLSIGLAGVAAFGIVRKCFASESR